MVSPRRVDLEELWFAEFTVTGMCGLCGNSGIIDTRKTLSYGKGKTRGGRFFCICPNGRKAKRLLKGQLPPEETTS